MLSKQHNFHKAVNFESSKTHTYRSRKTEISADESLKIGKTNKENSQCFEIPMSCVVSSAQHLCLEARDVQQQELFQRSCKIDEFCKDILSKGKTSSQEDTVNPFFVQLFWLATDLHADPCHKKSQLHLILTNYTVLVSDMLKSIPSILPALVNTVRKLAVKSEFKLHGSSYSSM